EGVQAGAEPGRRPVPVRAAGVLQRRSRLVGGRAGVQPVGGAARHVGEDREGAAAEKEVTAAEDRLECPATDAYPRERNRQWEDRRKSVPPRAGPARPAVRGGPAGDLL